MNCIDTDIIQRYIDGETDVRETEQIEKHIADCSSCANQIEEQKAFTNAIKTDLQKLVQPVDIPEFSVPTTLKRRLNFKRMAYFAAAACVAFVMMFVLLPERHKEDENNFLMMYSVITDFDANRTFSQQEKSVFVTDRNGNIVEF